MATTGTEKHFRLCLMVMKGGTKAACSLLLKRVKDICPEDFEPFPWSLDDFLLSKKEKILKSKFGREKAKVLFPTGKRTNLSEWDLSLVCCILTQFCELPSLLSLDVERLRTIRNELCHASEPTVDNNKFTDYLKTIKIVIERILEESEEDGIKCEVQRIVKDIETKPLCLEETLREMHKFYSMERNILEKLDQMSDVQEAVLAKVQNFDSLLDMKINKQLDMKLRETSSSFEFPTLEFHIDLINLSQEKEEHMSSVLVELFEEAINKDDDFKSKLPTELYLKLREVVNKTVQLFLSRGWQIVRTKRKCVQLDIRCDSFKSLADLVRSYINGELEVAFIDLKDAVSKITAEDVAIEPVIYKDEFWNVMFQTLSLLGDHLSENTDKDAVRACDAHNSLMLTTQKLESGRISNTAKDFQHVGLHSCFKEIENALLEEFDEPDVRLQAKCVEMATVSYEISEIKATGASVDNFYPSMRLNEDRKSDDLMVGYEHLPSASFQESNIATEEGNEKTRGFQTIAAFELYRAQIYIANFLELAWIHLSCHLDIANEVLSMAQSAHSLHTTSRKMFLNMHRVAKEVRRHVSLLADGLSVQKASLLEKKMNNIIPLAQDLAYKTESILKRCKEIEKSTNEVIAHCKGVQSKYSNANRFDQRLQEYAQKERNESKQMMNDIIEEAELLRDKSFTQHEERHFQTNRLETKTVESTVENTDPPVMDKDWTIVSSELHSASGVEERDLARQLHIGTLNEKMIAATLRPGTALTGGIKGTALETLDADLNIFDIFTDESEKNILDALMTCYVDSLTRSRHGSYQQQSVLDKVFRQHAKVLKSQNKIEGHDGVNTLQEVITQFQYSEIQLGRIVDCWSYMVSLMTIVSGMLAADASCLTVELIHFIELLSCISDEWGWFERICQDYANASEAHVEKMYEFLSVNLENMTDEERSRRERQLLKEMEDIIKRASPQGLC